MFTRVHSFWLLLVGSIVAVGALAALMLWKSEPSRAEPLVLYCAEALREPIQEIVSLYEEQTGQRIEVRYGESQTVLTKLEMSSQGDVFLPADESYVAEAHKKGLLDDVFEIAKMNATLVINPQSGKTIASWDDLLQKGRIVAVANPQGAAVSRLTIAHLGEARWKQLHPNCIELGPVTHVANAVKTDQKIDAGIIWDSMLASPNYQMLKAVPIDELKGITATVKIATVKKSARPTEALAFTRFVAGSSGLLKKHGFTVIESSAPSDKKDDFRIVGTIDRPVRSTDNRPEIVIYAGAMLRPAIEETIKEFSKREGVTVNTVYNGCGILVSQMKSASKGPDLFFACDPTFMADVADRFETPKIVSRNQLVIAVKKGNPHQIESLHDLGKEGLRVGVGHEQQCALGAITKGVMIRNKTYKAVQENIVVRTPSGDMLINQLRRFIGCSRCLYQQREALRRYRSRNGQRGELHPGATHCYRPFDGSSRGGTPLDRGDRVGQVERAF